MQRRARALFSLSGDGGVVRTTGGGVRGVRSVPCVLFDTIERTTASTPVLDIRGEFRLQPYRDSFVFSFTPAQGDLVWVNWEGCWWPAQVHALSATSIEKTAYGEREKTVALVHFFDIGKVTSWEVELNTGKTAAFIPAGVTFGEVGFEILKQHSAALEKDAFAAIEAVEDPLLRARQSRALLASISEAARFWVDGGSWL